LRQKIDGVSLRLDSSDNEMTKYFKNHPNLQPFRRNKPKKDKFKTTQGYS